MNAKTTNKTLTKSNAKTQRAKRAKKAPKEQQPLAQTREEYVEQKPAETTPTGLELSTYGKNLLKRAIDNVRDNKGANMPDPTAKTEIAARANLLEITGGDLSIAVLALAETGGNNRESAGMIYSLCNAVMKGCMFLGNNDLRHWLDPNHDTDLPARADPREDVRTAPYGLGPDHVETETSANGEPSTFDVICLDALRDINAFLNATVEAFGWESAHGLPYHTVRDEQNDAYHSFYDVEVALDELERARQKRLGQMRQKRAEQMGRAGEAARKLVLAAIKAAQVAA